MGRLSDLNTEERKRLVRFVCAFAWADLDLGREESDFIQRLVRRLELGPDVEVEVAAMLRSPPDPDKVDPNLIPTSHREIFVDTIRALLAADLTITEEEKESMQLLEKLLSEVS